MSAAIPEASLAELLERYEVILLDAYGVLVHSSGPLPGAVELIGRLTQRAQPFYVLTNDASKQPQTGALRYQSFGLSITADHIISAGSLLRAYFAEQGLQGKRCRVLGPPDGIRYVERAGGVLVHAGEHFDVAVLLDEAGFDFLAGMDQLLTDICRHIDRGQPPRLVCPNPDLMFLKSPVDFGFASGTMAAMLEGALDLRYPGRNFRFQRLGKPFPTIYAEALRRSGTRNMLMIGDQLETDIRGARDFGIDSAWLSTGVIAELDDQHPVRPTYRLRSLKL